MKEEQAKEKRNGVMYVPRYTRCTVDRGESIDARYNINAVIIRRHI